MIRFLLGIDAGATKIVGRLESLKEDKVWTNRDGPASLTNQPEQSRARVRQLTKSLIEQAGAQAGHVSMACGIAGACNELNRQALASGLADMGLGHYYITTDAHTSLLGASAGKPMISVAVGTGSVAMRLTPDGELRQFGGWGFVAGDQGGGADIGRNLLRSALIRFDRGDYDSDPFLEQLFDRVGHSKDQILNWIRKADPADFGELARLIEQFPDHYLSRQLLAQAGHDISALVHTAQTRPAMAVTLSGGLAEVLEPWLDEDVRLQLVRPAGDSVDGALMLARQALEQGSADD